MMAVWILANGGWGPYWRVIALVDPTLAGAMANLITEMGYETRVTKGASDPPH